MSGRRRGEYGFDAAYVAAAIGGLGVAEAAVAAWSARRDRWAIAAVTGVGGLWCVAASVNYAYSTRRGKFAVWAELLDDLHLAGDERVLDVGCGRGAVLMSVAERLPRGKAVGVDIWRAQDQVGNSRSAAERNAILEGVADRVDLVDGDARSLPFPDGSFDLVVSSLAIHNIAPADGRATALGEAMRVLRPGGRLCIVDLHAPSAYADIIRASGCVDVVARRVDWRMWFGGGPFTDVGVVSARKPA